jgi:Fanconi anemia group M protein
VTVVVCDVHERWSTVPARLAGLGVPIERRPLAVGDYAIGRTVIVERKRVRDFHEFVAGERFWQQIGRLRMVACDPYLLVEGRDLYDGPLHPNAVQGCILAVMDLGVRVVCSSDEGDSASWLQRLTARYGAERPRLDKPAYARRSGPSAAMGSVAVLAAIPGISIITATALLDHFGSLRAVLAATPDQWAEVRAVGPARVNALASVLNAEHGS